MEAADPARSADDKNGLSVEIQRGPLSPVEQVSKRAVDIAGALLALIVSGHDLDIIAIEADALHLPLADASVWARVTDGALLVVREGIAERGPLKRALESLKKADLLGVVVNGSSNGNHHNYYQRYAAARSSVKS